MMYYIHRALYKFGFFKMINLVLSRSINHKNYKIPIISGIGYHHLLDHEKWLDNLLIDILPHVKGAFFDVGMNIGQTLLKVKSIDPEREYFGFEPNGVCCYYCRKLSEMNNFRNCSFFPVGLYNETKILSLYMDKDYATGATILYLFRKKMDNFSIKINVPVFKGDFFINHVEHRVGLIKVDVEGAELEVIEGLDAIINRDKPWILLEILPVYSLNDTNGLYRKNRQDQLLAILSKHKYDMFLVDELGAKLIRKTEIQVHADMRLTNYLFIPEGEKLYS